MYQLPCPDCQVDHSVEVSHNPQQDYQCPDCGYVWTDRKSAGWESLTLTVAGNALIIAVALMGLASWWEFWLFAAAIVSAYGVIKLVSEAASMLEDWLDPAEDLRSCRP
jgi:hypothetical protein